MVAHHFCLFFGQQSKLCTELKLVFLSSDWLPCDMHYHSADDHVLLAIRYGPCEVGDLQDRMKRAVALLGPEEVKNIMREEGKIEVMPKVLLPSVHHLCTINSYRSVFVC